MGQSVRKLLTVDIINERLLPNNIQLCGEFTGSKNKHEFKCLVCSHNWNALYNKKMTKCPECSKSARRIQKDELAELIAGAEKRGIRLLTEYMGMRKPVTCECLRGHTWDAEASSVLRKGYGCPHCSGRVLRSTTEVNGELSKLDKQCTCVEYNGNNKKSLFICGRCSTEYQAIPSNVLKGNSNNCPKCHSSDKKISKPHERLLGQGFTLLSDYDNSWTKAEVRCTSGHTFSATMSNLIYNKQGCPQCTTHGKSKPEGEINAIVGGETNTKSVITPYELDVYSVEHKFAVEYNGLVWHSFGKSSYSMFNNHTREDNNNHLHKTELCESNGLQLFHIFENEWLNDNKRAIWESVLKNKMGISNRIYARKCVIRELDSKVTNEFLEDNHLQGKCVASIKLGLYHKNTLVSVMTFGKSRYSKDYQYELIRFCSKLNTTVVGGASKLLKYFERNYSPSSIVSYANRRWSAGSLYETLGFEFLHNSAPNYFYFRGDDSSELHSRVKFQKHKLKGKLDVFDPNLTETQNMYNNGYRKIFDSGNKVYVWNSI